MSRDVGKSNNSENERVLRGLLLDEKAAMRPPDLQELQFLAALESHLTGLWRGRRRGTVGESPPATLIGLRDKIVAFHGSLVTLWNEVVGAYPHKWESDIVAVTDAPPEASAVAEVLDRCGISLSLIERVVARTSLRSGLYARGLGAIGSGKASGTPQSEHWRRPFIRSVRDALVLRGRADLTE